MLSRHCNLDEYYQRENKSGELSSKVMLYSCATMWHENEFEMLKLMTSIMR